MTRVAALVSAFALAGPAAALAPPMSCPGGDLTGTPYEIGSYSHNVVGEGFVYYNGFETATEMRIHVLEHCADRRQLVLRTERSGAEFERDLQAQVAFDEMVWGEETFTPSQMAERLRDMGADVEMRTVSYESCACALY